MPVRKTFVLDTSVLLAAGKQPLGAFDEHEVVLPLVVLQELESKRNDPELGLTARSALRALEELRVKYGEQLKTGVPVNDLGGTLRIETNHVTPGGDVPEAVMKYARTHDSRILVIASNLKSEDNEVVLVSQDLPMRLLAEGVLGVPAEEYHKGSAVDAGYTGMATIDVDDDAIGHLYSTKALPLPAEHLSVCENTSVVLNGTGGHALGRVRKGHILLVDGDRDAFGVKGRSAEQRLALAHLLDPSIPIVSLGGPAGTGKTLLALAAGLEQIMEQSVYDRIVVFRSVYAVGGQELGFLPGTEAEKMDPWAAAIYDALGAFVHKNVMEEVKARNLIEVLPLTHIRGRTLNKTFVLVDEAQNLERHVILTALSRLGEGSKAVLSWDVAQRDNLHVGRHNGIHAVVEKLKGESLFAHVTLRKSERSAAAELVSRVLDDMEV